MSKTNSKEQIDADILQCKADILRSGDIIPPYDKKTRPKNKSDDTKQQGENLKKTEAGDNDDTVLLSIEKEKEPSKNIIPPLRGEKTKRAKEASEISAKKVREDISSIPIESMHPKEPTPLPAEKVNHPNTSRQVETEQALQKKSEIPKFDLAEDIMAEQRKITAIKRKAPGKKTETQKQELEVKPIGYPIEQSMLSLSEQERIVAEIVTRDIEKLCRGNYSTVNK